MILEDHHKTASYHFFSIFIPLEKVFYFYQKYNNRKCELKNLLIVNSKNTCCETF